MKIGETMRRHIDVKRNQPLHTLGRDVFSLPTDALTTDHRTHLRDGLFLFLMLC